MNLPNQQGYDCDPTFHKYYTSVILSETNVMDSSSKSTRHININSYFISNHFICKALNVKKCFTDDMLEDFPRNYLQGIKFDIKRGMNA